MSSHISKYPEAFRISQRLLDSLEIDQFPIDIFTVLEMSKKRTIVVSTLSQYNAWGRMKHQDRFEPLIIRDAKCFYDPAADVYLIVYNEHRRKVRIRFSLAHELGHIVLEHLNDERTEISRGGVDDPSYYAMEGAANTFAGNFLAPPILVGVLLKDEFLSINFKRLASRFEISPEAMEDYRLDDYLYWRTKKASPAEERILARCIHNLYARTCEVCGATFSLQKISFCCICGTMYPDTYYLNEATTMIFSKIKLRDDGRVEECPTCQNEEHSKDANFCVICGKPAVNRCSDAIKLFTDYPQCDHKEPLSGNARYCPYCGNETTFFKAGLLPTWMNDPCMPLKDVPDDDGDLPF